MADKDVFGDPSLFDEFDKEEDPPDKLLLSKFREENDPKKIGQFPLKHVQDTNAGFDEETWSDDPQSGENYESDDDGEDGASISEKKNYTEVVGRISNTKTNHSFSSQQRTDPKIHELAAEILDLKRENLRLKEKSRITDPTVHFCDGQGPAAEIIFMNHDFSRIYRAEIELFITQLLERHAEDKGHLPQITLRANNVALSSKSDKLLSDDAISHINSSTVLGCSQFYTDFIMDAMGWPLVDDTPELTDGWAIPRYEGTFPSSLPAEGEEEFDDLYGPKPSEKARMPKSTCFNCGESHAIKDCQEPKDQQRIKQKMNEFQKIKAEFQRKNPRQQRYHVSGANEAEAEGKFEHLRPGVVSTDLREALGLERNQMPPFIYQMRMLGYPPGWLEEAKHATSSGLEMFDRQGNAVEQPEQAAAVAAVAAVAADGEEGEVTDETDDANSCNTDKIIDFPGFNGPVPRGMYDDYRNLGMPPMQPQHEKSVLVMYLKDNTGNTSKRSHSESSTGPERKKRRSDVNPNNSDMDISSQDEEEATLAEMLAYQKQLKEQLAAEGGAVGGMVPPPPPTPPSQPKPPLPPGTPPVTPQSERTASQSSLLSTPSEFSTPICSTPRSCGGRSLIVTPGTPLPNDTSGKLDLPTCEQWQKDIIEHIPYENLPGATGTFEKLRKTLKKINKLKKD